MLPELVFRILFYGVLAGIAIHVLKVFGIRGLILRVAMFWAGAGIFSAVINRGLPFTHNDTPRPDHGIALGLYLAAFAAASVVFWCSLIFDNPTRWVIDRPPFKWTIYVLAALTLVIKYGRGWVY